MRSLNLLIFYVACSDSLIYLLQLSPFIIFETSYLTGGIRDTDCMCDFSLDSDE